MIAHKSCQCAKLSEGIIWIFPLVKLFLQPIGDFLEMREENVV